MAFCKIKNIRQFDNSVLWHYEHWILYPLRRFWQKKKVVKVRQKNQIKVLFVLIDIGTWKTESLYLAMIDNPRFLPILGVTMTPEMPYAKEGLIAYLNACKYNFVDMDIDVSDVISNISPDIIFYEKPYNWCYRQELFFRQHLDRLFCYVGYAFHSTENQWDAWQPLYEVIWQQYFENELAASNQRKCMMKDKGKQIVITGMPIQDVLLKDKASKMNPWKPLTGKKRIIYAPHHTIGCEHMKGLALSTFIENADFMLQMVEKYRNSVQWAFKPHPLLYGKLIKYWGKEQTDNYYHQWEVAENSQLETGAYDALFQYSDAMIHDCSSFTVEYLYTLNPVMFLERQVDAEAERTLFSSMAHDMHYKGYTHEDIEQFISNVVNGKDMMKDMRNSFFRDYLLPPHGKTACENIINAILGIEEYKELH